MPATFDANRFTILNTITQDQWYQRFQESAIVTSPTVAPPTGTAMVAIAELRAEDGMVASCTSTFVAPQPEECRALPTLPYAQTLASLLRRGEPGKPDITNETFCFCDSCRAEAL